MPKRPRTPELEGLWNNEPYKVKQDGKRTKNGCAYKIFFGPQCRRTARFPPGEELTHENTVQALVAHVENVTQKQHQQRRYHPGAMGRPGPVLSCTDSSSAAAATSVGTAADDCDDAAKKTEEEEDEAEEGGGRPKRDGKQPMRFVPVLWPKMVPGLVSMLL